MFDEPPPRQPYEALADLLIGGPVEQTAPKLKLTGPQDHPRVDAVIPTALPGMDDPWVGQYAQMIGREVGGAALVRSVGDRLHLELVEATHTPRTAGADATSVVETFRQEVGVWIVQASIDDAAQWRPRRWVVLCGANHDGRLAGYRQIKQLVQCGVQAEIGLMFAGCEPSDADEAAQRLCHTARRHLGHPIHFIGSRQRMEPIRRQIVARLDGPVDRIRLDMARQLGATSSESVARAHTHAARRSPHLYQFLDGARPVNVSIPHAHDVELAIDDQNQLHLLARSGQQAEPAALALLRALAWTRRHPEDLPDQAVPTSKVEPALHLFTDDPKSCALLRWVGEPETPLRLHLLRDANAIRPKHGHLHVEL
jgi:hypothetical protein